MTQERAERHEINYTEDHFATQKDLRILSLELEQKILELKVELKLEIEKRINSVVFKLGSLIIASSGILFGLLSYFHK